MLKPLKQVIVAYISTLILLVQGVQSVSVPYRAVGLIVQTSKVLANPALLASVSASAAALFTPNLRAASTVTAPTTTCPTGYTRSGGKCIKKEETPILKGCATAGYEATKIYEPSMGIWIDTCVMGHDKLAETVCPSGQESGGTNYQQCRTVSTPVTVGTSLQCPSGESLSNGKCYGAWYTPSTSAYVCADLCNITLSDPTATCPASEDPIALIEPLEAQCTNKGVSDGTCYTGQVVELQMPNLDWSIENPLEPMTSTNPVMCYRSSYEAVTRTCPTPNSTSPSNSEPEWGTPSGADADNPSYYDAETGVPTTCTRTWTQELVNECPAGKLYDDNLGGCVAEEYRSCPSGYTYKNGLCVASTGDVSCPSTHTYDASSGSCVLKVDDSSSFDGAYQIGADFGWAVGGVQKGKTQQADQNGNVTLDMGLLNEEANADLQAKSNELSGVQAIGTYDQQNNSYADISNTYWNEQGQTAAITQNYASYENYLSDSSGNKNPNLSAEAYAVVRTTIDDNRPPGINPDSEWMQSSSDTIESITDGTNTWFGDCDTAATTKKVLDPSKSIQTTETCTKPVTTNYNSCQVKRKVREPTLKILEGAESSKVEIIDRNKIRLTIGTFCDNCLSQRPGENCSMYTDNIVIKMAESLSIVDAKFTYAIWDDMILVSTGSEEVFRKAPSPWSNKGSGWPSTSDHCEQGTSFSWSGSEDVTTAFQKELNDDHKIDFNYIIGVGGLGEAQAVVEIEFDGDVLTDWEYENIYEPAGCYEKVQSNYYKTSGWSCDLGIDRDNTIGMEDWIEWDNVKNWNITNNGYDATSTLNGPWSAYGSADNVGSVWFEGNVTMPTSDDDTFGFIIGYPENPVWNKDPKSDVYDPNAPDSDDNHYYMVLWTSNEGSNGAVQGLHMVKSYANYTDLENRWPSVWSINFPSDKYQTDKYGNSVLVIDNIYSNPSKIWQKGHKYKFEVQQDIYGYFKFKVDGTVLIDIPPSSYNVKTGRFAFTSVSLQGVKLTGLHKLFEENFPPLFPGDSNPSICMAAHANDVTYDPLHGGAIGTGSDVWTYDQLSQQPNRCEAYENSETCSWSGRECVEGYETSDGACLFERNIYTCVDNSQAWSEVPVESTCDQVLPCTDGNCDVRTSGENTDFAEVVTQLAVVNEMRTYMECSDPSDASTCAVFTGKQRHCSYDQFGLIDCCEEFKGRTIDLFKLATNMMSVASYADSQLGISKSMGSMMFGTDGTIIGSSADGLDDGWVPNDWWGVTDTGAWKTATDTYDAVSNTVTDAWGAIGLQSENTHASEIDNSKGNDSENPTNEDGSASSSVWVDYLSNMLKSKIKAVMIDKASTFVVNLLPDVIKTAIVDAGRSLGLGTAGGQAAPTAASVVGESMAMVANFLSAVAAAYAAVQIALALYQKFNGCKDEEMDMPQELKAKKCFYAYKEGCNKKFGICMNKNKDHHCCFESVLSRIIIEQGITQADAFGKSYSRSEWYTQEQCRGMTLDEVALVDFNQINMDEWYNLMVQSGTLPDGDDDLVEWTKDKSYVNPYGRSDAKSLQDLRNENGANEAYRAAMDKQDVLSDVDCSKTSNLQGCQTGIFSD